MSKMFKGQQAFSEEARDELLPELENTLLALIETPADKELINRAFRVLHSLKGSGAMFGFERLSGLAHEIESLFDDIRDGKYRVDNKLVELTLSAKDLFQALIDDPDSVDDTDIDNMVMDFKKIMPSLASSDNNLFGDEDFFALTAYHIRFKPDPGIFTTGNKPIYLLDELYDMGTALVISHAEDIPPLETMNPEECYTWWDIVLVTDKLEKDIRDVFIFVEDDCQLDIAIITDNVSGGQEEVVFDALEPLLSGNNDTDTEDLRDALEQIISAGRDGADDESFDAGSDDLSQQSKGYQPVSAISSMRVQASKLDKLVNLVGEMVIAQTRLSRLAEEKEDQELVELAETMERLTDDLRSNTLDIRMMPIGSSFDKFKRVVWDFSSRSNKEVELITEGAATELDKTVIERLADPLVHLLRNSIDHGIETPKEREAAGKPRQGKIVFSAEQSGGSVIITIVDDGRGIDTELVKARAIEKGLLSPEAAISEQDLLNIIFEPGFSTNKEVSDLSGRGVGMDVVKQNISTIRGKVQVSSVKGEGTKIKMTIPLTLAIIDGLKVKIGEDFFIIPISSIRECLELDEESRRQRFIDLRDQLVPFISLRNWFSINGSVPEDEQVVIAAAEKKLVGLVVDEVIGLQQVVIKNLGKFNKDIPGVSGATIQGDGSLALILDVDPLVQKAQEVFENA